MVYSVNYSPSPIRPIIQGAGTAVVGTVSIRTLTNERFAGARSMLRSGSFWREEHGQDLIEYSLLLAFISLSGAAMFIGMGQTTSGLWSIVNSRLAAANQASS